MAGSGIVSCRPKVADDGHLSSAQATHYVVVADTMHHAFQLFGQVNDSIVKPWCASPPLCMEAGGPNTASDLDLLLTSSQ